MIHGESGPRSFLEERARRHHDVHSVAGLGQAIRSMPKFRPELMIVHLSAKKPEALELLRHLRRNGAQTPVLLVGEREIPFGSVLEITGGDGNSDNSNDVMSRILRWGQ